MSDWRPGDIILASKSQDGGASGYLTGPAISRCQRRCGVSDAASNAVHAAIYDGTHVWDIAPRLRSVKKQSVASFFNGKCCYVVRRYGDPHTIDRIALVEFLHNQIGISYFRNPRKLVRLLARRVANLPATHDDVLTVAICSTLVTNALRAGSLGRISPRNRTLPGDYYTTTFPVEEVPLEWSRVAESA